MLGVTICTKCKGEKEDNNKPYCTPCRAGIDLDYSRTKKGVVTQLYKHQRTNSKKRGHRMPEYSKKELEDWLYSQSLFHELYNEWVQSGYKNRLKPSIDRKDDDIHYCMANIQLMTWQANNKKGHKDRGTVIEIFRLGKSVGVFKSLKQAGRELKDISHWSLGECLKDGQTIKGYTVLAR